MFKRAIDLKVTLNYWFGLGQIGMAHAILFLLKLD